MPEIYFNLINFKTQNINWCFKNSFVFYCLIFQKLFLLQGQNLYRRENHTFKMISFLILSFFLPTLFMLVENPLLSQTIIGELVNSPYKDLMCQRPVQQKSEAPQNRPGQPEQIILTTKDLEVLTFTPHICTSVTTLSYRISFLVRIQSISLFNGLMQPFTVHHQYEEVEK